MEETTYEQWLERFRPVLKDGKPKKILPGTEEYTDAKAMAIYGRVWSECFDESGRIVVNGMADLAIHYYICIVVYPIGARIKFKKEDFD